MIISVKDALRNEGERFQLDFQQKLDPIEYMGSVSFPEPIKVSGFYFADGKNVHFIGTIQAQCVFQCDRCGKDFSKQLEFDFDEIYSENPEEELFVISHNDTVDIQPLLNDTILSMLPIERLCREDCKGLCPKCGVDKNFSSCSCSDDDGDNPFAVLRGLVD